MHNEIKYSKTNMINQKMSENIHNSGKITILSIKMLFN